MQVIPAKYSHYFPELQLVAICLQSIKKRVNYFILLMTHLEFKQHILKTLVYYEIFDHPLTAKELFCLFPRNSLTRKSFEDELATFSSEGIIASTAGFYHLPQHGNQLPSIRLQRERLAQHRLRVARCMGQIIKRCPFVRGVFISGDLSKGVANPNSDIDYVIVTEPSRLWICRILLTLFKKIFLLNRKKYFCLNYYFDTNTLTVEDKNYYTATEVAHLKPLFNIELFLRFMNANGWIREYFPNYKGFAMNTSEGNNQRSLLQKVLELPFRGTWPDRLDQYLMQTMRRIWKKRYPQYDDATRERIFRCSVHESRAYVGNFSDKVLSLYQKKLIENNLI